MLVGQRKGFHGRTTRTGRRRRDPDSDSPRNQPCCGKPARRAVTQAGHPATATERLDDDALETTWQSPTTARAHAAASERIAAAPTPARQIEHSTERGLTGSQRAPDTAQYAAIAQPWSFECAPRTKPGKRRAESGAGSQS